MSEQRLKPGRITLLNSQELGWRLAEFVVTSGEQKWGTLEVNTPHCGDPSARSSLSLRGLRLMLCAGHIPKLRKVISHL